MLRCLCNYLIVLDVKYAYLRVAIHNSRNTLEVFGWKVKCSVTIMEKAWIISGVIIHCLIISSYIANKFGVPDNIKRVTIS